MAEKRQVTKNFIHLVNGKNNIHVVTLSKKDEVQHIYVANARAASGDVVIDEAKKTVTFDADYTESFAPVQFMSGVTVLRIK